MAGSTKKELYDRIIRAWPSLSQKKKRVADFILEDYKRLFLMNAREIAQECQVSEPTIMRFVMDLGFSGYGEFMQYVKGLLHFELTAVERLLKASKKSDERTTLEAYYQSTVINLGNMLNSVSDLEMKKIARTVYSADSVLVAGYRASATLAFYFGYLLEKIRGNVLTDTTYASDVLDYIAVHGQSVLLFVIAFPRYPRRAIEVIDYAKHYNAKVFGLSDTPKSPIITRSDEYCIIDVESLSFVDPFPHIITFLGALVHDIAFIDKDATMRRLTKIEEGVIRRKDFLSIEEDGEDKKGGDVFRLSHGGTAGVSE